MEKKFFKTLVAAGLLSLAGTVSATTITFDDTSLNPGSPNVFDFDAFSLASFDAVVTQTDSNGDGTLFGPDDFVEIGATGVVNFLDDVGAVQQIISPGVSGINLEYELLFDLNLAGSANFTPFDFDNADLDNDNTTGADFLQGLIEFDNATSTLDLYYDTVLGGGIDGGSTLIGSISLIGVNECITSNDLVNNLTFGSCLLLGDFTPLPGFFAQASSGVDLTALPPGVPTRMDFDINIAGFTPQLQFVYPGGPGSSQVINVQHDGSARIVVPEPSSVALLGLGLLGVAGFARRKNA